jgi:hypothetical protein
MMVTRVVFPIICAHGAAVGVISITFSTLSYGQLGFADTFTGSDRGIMIITFSRIFNSRRLTKKIREVL